MKVTKSLKERMFVMFLERSFDLARLVGEPKKMEHHVEVAKQETTLAVDQLNSEAGGEA